jgi:hypothetical protein
MDILVTDKLTGEVGVLHNLGPGVFAPPALYAAGTGLYSVTVPSAGGPAALTSLEATAGVAAGALTQGGPDDLLVINPGSNTLSVLRGLGGGRFADPVTLPTATPALAVLVADLEGNGIPDTIVLSAGSVSVFHGDGRGGFLPDPFTISAGLDPTGMTLADLSGDGTLDLLVSNGYGDVLILRGNGDGTFQSGTSTDQNVALAVLPNGSPTPDFIFADQGLDEVVVDYSSGQTKQVANRSSGLLAPGAVALADLNGDSIPDLIVANSGSNNVLVYPGIGNGQFGPALNDGNGFVTGTNPVGITVANLNGRPDLIIANKGSNDVSILLNVATADGGFTFVPGPRLQAGEGPVATTVAKVNGSTDLIISNSVSNDVWIEPRSGGSFNDHDPVKLPVGTTPGPILVGDFTAPPNLAGSAGLQIAVVNADSNNVTIVSDFTTADPVFKNFSTGGLDPSAAFAVGLGSNGLQGLVIANTGDGTISLLGGNAGALDVEGILTASQTGLPRPSSLVLASVSISAVGFYATTEGVEGAALLAFILGGAAPTLAPSPSSIPAAASTLLPLSASEKSLALVSTLLMVSVDTQLVLGPQSEQASASEAAAVISFLPEATSTSFTAASSAAGQSLLSGDDNDEEASSETEAVEAKAGAVPQQTADWTRFFLDIDGLIDRVCAEIQGQDFGADKPDRVDESALDFVSDALSLWAPNESNRPRIVTERARHVDRKTIDAIDDVRATATAWVHLAIASMMVIRVNLPDKRLRRAADPTPCLPG